jgi:membrane associated rhomboid family serine protease
MPFNDLLSNPLLVANAKFLLGWFLVAWVLTFLDLHFFRSNKSGQGLPRLQAWSISGMFGVLFAPFVHNSWNHLRGNTLPFLILGGLILLRYPIDLIVITLTIAIVAGALGFFFGRTAAIVGNKVINVRSSGLSRLIYGYGGFLVALFYFDRTISSAILLALVVLLYGRTAPILMYPNRITRMFRIGWDGHLIGFLVGGFVAAYLPYLRPLSIALLRALNLPTQFPGIRIGGYTINEAFYTQQLPPLISQYGPQLLSYAFVLFQAIAVAWVIAFIDFMLFNGRLNVNYAIRPWQFEPWTFKGFFATIRGLLAIPLAPVLHANWEQLANNTLWFLVFGLIIALVRPTDFVAISVWITLISGVLTWFTALPGLYRGANALITGYMGFLLSLYYFENSTPAAGLLIGTLVVLALIDLRWRRMKWQDWILLRKNSFITQIVPKTFDASWWQFLGFISGVIVAAYLPELRSQFNFFTTNFRLPF